MTTDDVAGTTPAKAAKKFSLDTITKSFSLLKDLVVVAFVVFLSYKYIPLLLFPSETSDYEISEINLIVVKLRPVASEQAVALPSASEAPGTEAQPASAPGGERPTAALESADTKRFAVQTTQGLPETRAVTIPKANIIQHPPASAAAAAERPVPNGWSYLGTVKSGTYSQDVLFEMADDSDLPKDPDKLAGMTVRALTDVYLRDREPYFTIGWNMGTRIGVVTEGVVAKVLEVKKIPALGGGYRVWLRFGKA